MLKEQIRSKEVRTLKLKPMALAPAATFKFRNELEIDLEILVEGSNVTIKQA